MASVLDVGILDYFSPVWIFLLVAAVMFGVLEVTNLFGKNRGLNGLVAFLMGLLFILTDPLRQFLNILTPWFVVLIVFTMCIVLIFLFLGVKPGVIATAAQEPGVVWFVIILIVILFIAVLTYVFGPQMQAITQGSEGGPEGLTKDIGLILFNPKVIGASILLLIAAQAVRLIAKGL